MSACVARIRTTREPAGELFMGPIFTALEGWEQKPPPRLPRQKTRLEKLCVFLLEMRQKGSRFVQEFMGMIITQGAVLLQV